MGRPNRSPAYTGWLWRRVRRAIHWKCDSPWRRGSLVVYCRSWRGTTGAAVLSSQVGPSGGRDATRSAAIVCRWDRWRRCCWRYDKPVMIFPDLSMKE